MLYICIMICKSKVDMFLHSTLSAHKSESPHVVRVAFDRLYLVWRVVEMRKHQLAHAYVHASATNDSARVVSADIIAGNGVIHVIDAVVLPR